MVKSVTISVNQCLISSFPLSHLAPCRVLFCLLIALATAAAAAGGEPDDQALERKMFELVNADRKEQGKKPYEYDEALAAAGRAHSADMLENNFFAHKSPTTGMVADRLFAAKIKLTACGENIAMLADVEKAEAALMNSPGHRANILSNEFTHCGIGLVLASNGMLYITQVFDTPAPPVNLQTIGTTVLEKLNDARGKLGKRPLPVHAGLTKLASEYAAAAAHAGKPIAADLVASAMAAGLNNKQLGMTQVRTWNLEELAAAAALLAPRAGQIGLGFAENTEHKALGYGIVWAVVIFTEE